MSSWYLDQMAISILWRGMLPRGKGRSIPLPYGVWINRPQGLTAKSVRMKIKSCTHFMTYNRLDKEGNAGHSIIVTGWNGGRRKRPNDWPLVRTPSFSLVEVWKRKFSLRTVVGGWRCRPQKESLVLNRHWQETDANPAKLRERISRKKIRTESLDRS